MWVTVHTKNQVGDPLSDVLVQAYLDGELEQQATSVDGVALLNLEPGTTYQIRQYYAAVPSVVAFPYEVEVTEELSEFSIRTEVLQLPPPNSPVMCQCSGRILRVGEPYAEYMLQFRQPGSLISDGQQLVIYPHALRVQLQDGYGSVALPRGGTFLAEHQGSPEWEIRIPDLATAPLPSVLFPLVKSIIPESISVEVAVGESVSIPYSQLYYSGLLLSSAEIADGPPERYFDSDSSDPSMLFSTEDGTIASVLDQGGELVITGVFSGETSVRADLQDPWYGFLKLSGDYCWENLISITVTE